MIMKSKEIPVYLFTGFLEAGKTKGISGTLADKRFNSGENTLLLVCEEGIEEYELEKFPNTTVFIEEVDDESQLTPEFFEEMLKKHKIDRCVVEYNGMWMLDTLYRALPENWFVYQEIMFADSETFLTYNSNMRSLMADKLQSCELVVFNRPNENTDRMEFHKIVRGLSRRAAICYELPDGTMEYDEIEDPLPFDLDAPVVEIADRDYAVFYRDFSEDMEKYIGKTVKFKGIIAVENKFPKNTVVIGRHVMTCCEADIAYNGIVCKFRRDVNFKTRDWAVVTGVIRYEYNKLYKGDGPVIDCSSFDYSAPADPELATFY